MRSHLLHFAVAFLCVRCCAPNLPAQTNESVPEPAQIKLPLEYVNGHLFVDLEDAQLGRLHFLLDTGAERTSISPAATAKLPSRSSFWHHTFSNIGFGPDNPDHEYRLANLSLRSGNNIIFSGDALALPIDGQLSAALHHPVDGLLGWDFFERWCARIDYAAQTIALTEPNQCTLPANPHVAVSGEWSHHGLLLPAVITFANSNTVRVHLHVDTGNDSSLSLRPKFREAAGLQAQSNDTAVPGVGMNVAYTSDLVRTTEVGIAQGKLKFSDGSIVIGRAGSFSKTHWWINGRAESALGNDGEIGNAILGLSVITFDPVSRRLYIEKPAAQTQ